MIKKMSVNITFESSVCNEFGKYPCWKVEAYMLGDLIALAEFEDEKSTEKKVMKMCQDKVKQLLEY
jgi:hypothetical protein